MSKRCEQNLILRKFGKYIELENFGWEITGGRRVGYLQL